MDHSPLRKLSPEIREMIFKQVLTLVRGVWICFEDAEGECFKWSHLLGTEKVGLARRLMAQENSIHLLAITETCWEVRRETADLLFSENHFYFLLEDFLVWPLDRGREDGSLQPKLRRWLHRTSGTQAIRKASLCLYEPEAIDDFLPIFQPNRLTYAFEIQARLPGLQSPITMSIHPDCSITEKEWLKGEMESNGTYQSAFELLRTPWEFHMNDPPMAIQSVKKRVEDVHRQLDSLEKSLQPTVGRDFNLGDRAASEFLVNVRGVIRRAQEDTIFWLERQEEHDLDER